MSHWQQVPAERWCCDSIEAIEGGASLHHCFDNSQEGCDYLVLRHDPLNPSDSFSFSFRIRHGFAPSSQNNWQVAMVAEFHNGGGPLEGVPHILSGIVLGVNYSGSDDMVKIWGVDDGSMRELCSTSLNWQEHVGTQRAPLFRLDGDGNGGLHLYCSIDSAEQVPELLGSCRPEGIAWGRQLVLRYRYSSSRDQGLWMDRVVLEGHFEKDTVAPFVTRVEVVNERTLQVDFSERVVKPEPCSFSLTSEELPGGVAPDTLREVGDGFILCFSDVIINRVLYQLGVEEVADPDGNLLLDTVVPVMRNEAQWGDLVFHEVMADPDPAVRYHGEYLEFFNRSDHLVNLEGWLLMVNERSYLLTASMFEPVTTRESASELIPGDFGLLNGITLPNEGAILSLYSSEERLVHAASYKVPWDGPDWKKEGGWSLESPDANQVCTVSSHWEFSTDPGGGTPGQINSNQAMLVDMEPPVLLYAGLGDPGECLLHYSEPVRLSDGEKAGFTLDPGGTEPESVKLLDPLSKILQLCFSEDFQGWYSYHLSLSGVTDCMGNPSEAHELRAGTVSQPVYGSVVINEIMYDPEEGYPEYVELYLPGEAFYDLQDFSIHLVEEGGSPDNPVALTPHSRLFMPGQYLVVTDCVPHLADAYQLEVSGQWVEVEGLPGIKKSSGIIYLTDRAGSVVDMAIYNDEMHMELLSDPRGISLERISSKRSGSDPDNWHSAASIEGYATPGRENSQSADANDSDKLLNVEPEVFSPDNDGQNDLLNITLTTGGYDWVVGLWITDLQGNRVRVLANNHLAAPSICYTWDGEGKNGTMQPMGFYVVHARGYHPATGERWVRRRAVGLVYR
ncbi:MAG: lamin tail domain-containing protein [Bacteroidales bacterium]|nr:lamin tail domain-containing protein [Bacteroidales bacterium]